MVALALVVVVSSITGGGGWKPVPPAVPNPPVPAPPPAALVPPPVPLDDDDDVEALLLERHAGPRRIVVFDEDVMRSYTQNLLMMGKEEEEDAGSVKYVYDAQMRYINSIPFNAIHPFIESSTFCGTFLPPSEQLDGSHMLEFCFILRRTEEKLLPRLAAGKHRSSCTIEQRGDGQTNWIKIIPFV